MKRSALFLALIIAAAPTLAIDSSLNYQGSLDDGGQPASGSYDLQFTLQDSGGAAIGGALLRDNVNVVGGVFTVELDFGPTAFTGPDRFLQIGVRAGTSTGAFTALAPRSKVTPAPYAQVADDALFAASVADNAITTAKVADGAITSAKVANDSLTADDLAIGAVGADEIADASIRNADLGDDSVTSAKVVNATLVTADLADNAVTGAKILDDTITDLDLAPASVGAAEIKTAQVQARVSGNCSAGNAMRAVGADGSVSCEPVGGSAGWSLSGNALSGTEFLGSTNPVQLQLRVNNNQVGLFSNNSISPNVILGHADNATAAGVRGASISGGGIGAAGDPDFDLGGGNLVADAYGSVGGGYANVAGAGAQALDDPFATVAGGHGNRAAGAWSSVGGGRENQAVGDTSTVAGGIFNNAPGIGAAVGGGSNNCAGGAYSWAGGARAKVRPGTDSPSSAFGCSGVTNTGTASGDTGTFAWADSNAVPFTSTGPDQFLVRARGGVGINAPPLDNTVELTVTADADSADYASLWLKQKSGGNQGMLISTGDAVGTVSSLYIDHYNGASQNRRMELNANGSVVIRSTTNGSNTGVTLAANGNSWSSLSDRNSKMAIVAVDGLDVLDRLVALPLSTWSYISQGEGIRHMGPMAQDFAAAFGLGEDDTRINTVDIDGVALAAIQGLNAKLTAENADLRGQLEALAARVEHIEQAGR